jgi:hypothetical protein
MGVISVIFYDISMILGVISQLSGVISSSPNPFLLRARPTLKRVEPVGAPELGRLCREFGIYIYITSIFDSNPRKKNVEA